MHCTSCRCLGDTQMTKFVGREPLMTVIHDQMKLLRAGSGSIVLIRGPAGIGKRRAVSEALMDAAAAGFDVWRCQVERHDDVDGALAFQETACQLLTDDRPTRPSVLAVEGLQRADPRALASITDLLQRLVRRPLLVL